MNVALSAIAMVLFYALPKEQVIVRELLMAFALIGIMLALLNGIPMKMGGIANDGYNILKLSGDP